MKENVYVGRLIPAGSRVRRVSRYLVISPKPEPVAVGAAEPPAVTQEGRWPRRRAGDFVNEVCGAERGLTPPHRDHYNPSALLRKGRARADISYARAKIVPTINQLVRKGRQWLMRNQESRAQSHVRKSGACVFASYTSTPKNRTPHFAKWRACA